MYPLEPEQCNQSYTHVIYYFTCRKLTKKFENQESQKFSSRQLRDKSISQSDHMKSSILISNKVGQLIILSSSSCSHSTWEQLQIQGIRVVSQLKLVVLRYLEFVHSGPDNAFCDDFNQHRLFSKRSEVCLMA